MARILTFPHNKNKKGKTIFKFVPYRIVHSPAGKTIKKISTG